MFKNPLQGVKPWRKLLTLLLALILGWWLWPGQPSSVEATVLLQQGEC